MTLEELVTSIEAAEKTALIDADDPQYARTRTGILSAIGAAKARLETLKTQYAEGVLYNGVAIFLYGPRDKTEQFEQSVANLGGAVVIDGSEMYQRIALPVERAIGRDRKFGVEQTSIMHRVLGEVSNEVKVWISRALKLPTDVILPDAAATLAFVRNTVRAAVGDDLNATYLKTALAREALKIRYKDPVVPVLITNTTPEEAFGLGLLFGKGRANIELTEADEINEEFIKKTFKNIQKNLKKTK